MSLKKYKKIALSDKQLLDIVKGNGKIVLYPQIKKMKTIDEMFDKYDTIFLLFMSKPNYGHWCLLLKRDNEIEFFDPYSSYPDDSLKYIDKEFRDTSDQNYTYLTKLLIESPYDLEYNNHRFQKLDNDTKTCGRHCAIRAMLKDFGIEDYYHILKSLSKKLNLDFDELVTYLTKYINEK